MVGLYTPALEPRSDDYDELRPRTKSRRNCNRVRTYIGDYLLNGVALQRELAAIVVEKQGYPL